MLMATFATMESISVRASDRGFARLAPNRVEQLRGRAGPAGKFLRDAMALYQRLVGPRGLRRARGGDGIGNIGGARGRAPRKDDLPCTRIVAEQLGPRVGRLGAHAGRSST